MNVVRNAIAASLIKLSVLFIFYDNPSIRVVISEIVLCARKHKSFERRGYRKQLSRELAQSGVFFGQFELCMLFCSGKRYFLNDLLIYLRRERRSVTEKWGREEEEKRTEKTAKLDLPNRTYYWRVFVIAVRRIRCVCVYVWEKERDIKKLRKYRISRELAFLEKTCWKRKFIMAEN